VGEKLRFAAKQATGVEIFFNSRTYHMQAEHEVVLSTDACHSDAKGQDWLFPEMRLWNKAAICGSERGSALVRCCLRLPLIQ
jgi:hypothetical protein